MKRIKYFVVIILSIMVFVSGCSSNTGGNINSFEDTTTQESSTPEVSAIDALDTDEKEVFDSLVIASSEFFNPSSMRLLEISAPRMTGTANGRDPEPLGEYYIRVQATNKAGGTSSEYYIITTKSSLLYDPNDIMRRSASYIDEVMGQNQITSIPYDLWEDEHIGNINRALAEHWEVLGLS